MHEPEGAWKVRSDVFGVTFCKWGISKFGIGTLLKILIKRRADTENENKITSNNMFWVILEVNNKLK